MTATTQATITQFHFIFAAHGLPVTDNRTAFTSIDFQELLKTNCIYHVQSATPHTTTGRTRSKWLFGSHVNTHFDLVKTNLTSSVQLKQQQQKSAHKLLANERYFQVGDSVLLTSFHFQVSQHGSRNRSLQFMDHSVTL